MPETQQRIDFRLRTRKSGTRWGIGTGVLCAGVLAYAAITEPDSRWWVLGVLALVTLAVPVVVTGRMWLDPERGVFVFQRLWVLRAELALAQVNRARLTPNHGGQLMLALRAPGHRRRRFVGVLVLSDEAQMTLPADRLELLADALERWVAPEARADVADQLRAQAAYVATGAGLAGSPLAAQVSHLWIGLAGGAGAVGGASDLAS